MFKCYSRSVQVPHEKVREHLRWHAPFNIFQIKRGSFRYLGTVHCRYFAKIFVRRLFFRKHFKEKCWTDSGTKLSFKCFGNLCILLQLFSKVSQIQKNVVKETSRHEQVNLYIHRVIIRIQAALKNNWSICHKLAKYRNDGCVQINISPFK